ncbi:hypothetical protein BGX28_005160 [Mortierella sp. GBA30]|nr:hypothetical protein BGX28_005160 [Mortierella sp. GBA30]
MADPSFNPTASTSLPDTPPITPQGHHPQSQSQSPSQSPGVEQTQKHSVPQTNVPQPTGGVQERQQQQQSTSSSSSNRASPLPSPSPSLSPLSQLHPSLPTAPKKPGVNGLMERMASSSSIKRPSSASTTSSTAPLSPVGSLTTSSLHLPDDSFSNNPEDYDIRLPIGFGSSAVVYNAYYKPLNRRVAIKVIDLDMFERNQIDELRRETQVMALCKHVNVLRVNGAFVTDSKLYIVTPYLSAGSCLDIMKTAYPDGFDEISIATILKQALQGLDYLHKNGHIHRDVKAGNLLVDDDGSVLLADFGVSSSLMESGERRGMRKTFVGTPCWMAPEVMEQAGYDYKADIWSFGITAIELATGHAPFAKYPPIKVLMLTLSNDPPTLDRESTRHRYSKLFKEMIDCCLQKDPARRPSAEKLLGHSFFKQAKKKSYLVTGLLHNLPPLEQRPPKKAAQKATLPEKGVSWDFDGDETPSEPAVPESVTEPARRPRTVTFETPPSQPLSVLTAIPTSSANIDLAPVADLKPTDALPQEVPSSQSNAPQTGPTGDKPIKKSRFVIEDGSSGMSTPVLQQAPEAGSLPLTATSPGPSALSAALSGQSLQGLGVSSSTELDPNALPEVKKGRFSVKDTSSGVSSPKVSSIKTMPSDLQSPSRSLSSSPVEGASESVRIGGLAEQTPPSERKSRFEVHHTHGAPVSSTLAPANSTGTSSPAPSGTQGSPLSRESSQSRVAGDHGISRDNSISRVSRFSIESSAAPSEISSGSNSAVVSSTGTPNPSGGLLGAQSKRSRFQVSSVEGSKSSDLATGESSSSVHSTPTTSPTGSLLRGQPALLEVLGAQSVLSHLDTLYRQNEQQRAVLSELFAGFGLKAGTSGGSTRSTTEGGMSNTSSTSSGSLHRQEHGAGHMSLERQLQVVVRENESLRRENDALKRELDRLRRGDHEGCVLTPSAISSSNRGLKFIAKDRQDRLTAIGRYLADASRGYDIVGLQEVWVYDDYLRIQELVRDTLPYSKHWHSGVLGSGLVILSKFPIVSTTMRRFALNGDPFKFYHGDWYVGKCFVSATVAHPTCGEIEIFNTHLHAGYDPVGTPDSYLGCRVGEAWEMASVVKAATTQGRHVISLGDYNSAPNSLVVQLIRKQGGLTDSWDRIHPEPRDPIPTGLTPEEGVSIMGVTCDTPLNTWTKHHWLNYLTNDPVGERLDYIFFKETPEMVCTKVEVAVREQISGIGKPGSGVKNYSDHFGVNATFTIQPAVYHFQNRTPVSVSDSSMSMGTATASSTGSSSTTATAAAREEARKDQELTVDTLEQVLLILKQHLAKHETRCKFELSTMFPIMLILALGLIIAFFWIQPRWVAFILALVLSALSSGWIVHFLYGFLYGGETTSSYTNAIQEVQTVLDYKRMNEQNNPLLLTVSGSSIHSRGGQRQGLLQK